MKISEYKDGLYRTTMLNPVTGKRIAIYGKSEAEVKKKVRAKQKEFATAQASSTNLTLAYCIDKWYDIHKDSGITYHTIQSYIKPVKDCKDYFAQRKIKDILPSDIDEFVQQLVESDYKRQTINLRYIVLCKTFDWAIKNRIVTQNSARDTALPRNLTKGKRKRLSAAQVKKIKTSKDIYANMLLYTGARRCECLALRWEDINFKTNNVTIHQQVMWENGEKPYLAPLKTDASNGDVPLLKPLRDLLLPIRKKKGFIFSDNGKILTAHQFQLRWNKFVEDIGEKGNIEPHMFRHEYVSILHDAGVDAKSAQVLARHSKFETTMDIYTELEENANQKLTKKLNSFLESKPKKKSSPSEKQTDVML